MLTLPLIIAGNEISRNPVEAGARFYPDYRYQVCSAGPLEAAAAMGSARRAAQAGAKPGAARRAKILRKAAELFRWNQVVLEHTVRQTGMPISQVQLLLETIPDWFRAIPELYEKRFPGLPGAGETLEGALATGEGLVEHSFQPEGFCYAITPGNDPRAAALAAGNLAFLGLPFILRASQKDAVAPLVLKALLEAGLEPLAGSLVYFDARLQPGLHFRLLDACRVVWTFGPETFVDQALRYEQLGRRAVVDVPEELSPADLAHQVAQGRYELEENRRDAFAGKLVLRHSAGNCAAILRGPLDEAMKASLAAAAGFPTGCTATRSAWLVESEDAFEELADYFAGLKVGDPLDCSTQVGLIDPQVLDHLEGLVKAGAAGLRLSGGERLSRHQARPLLVSDRTAGRDRAATEGPLQPAQTLLEGEMPAYVLSVRCCSSLETAAEALNRAAGKELRLAVSLQRFKREEWLPYAARLLAWTVLIDRPTTEVVPVYHEGNDYALLLRSRRLLVL